MNFKRITNEGSALVFSLAAFALPMMSFMTVFAPNSVSAHSCAYPDFVAIDYSLDGNANSLYRYSYNPTLGDHGTLQDTIFDETAEYRGIHGFAVHEGIAYVSRWTGSAYELSGYVVDPTLPDYGTSSVVAAVYGTPTIDAQNDTLYILEGGSSIARVDLNTGIVSNLVSGGAQDGVFSQFGIEYGPDGRLYVLNQNDAVEVYDAQTGAFIEFFATGTGFGRYGSRDLGFDDAGNLYTTGNGGVRRFHGPGTPQAGTLIDMMTTDDWEHGFSFHPTTGELFIAQYAYDDDLEVFNYANGAQSSLHELPLNGGKDVKFIECSGPIVNQTPTVAAGNDITVFDDAQTAALSEATVVDDNFAGNPLTTQWNVVSAPAGGTAMISDVSAVNPTVTVDVLGDYVFELTAADGEFSVSDSVTLTLAPVPPNQAPSAAVSQPMMGQEFYTNSDVEVAVDATDTDGTVAQVEVFLDGVSQAVLTQAPYTLALTNMQNGTYVVSAIATDNDGDSTTTTDAVFNVVDQPPAPVGLDVYSEATGALESTGTVYHPAALSEVSVDPFEGATHYDFAASYYKYQYVEYYANELVDTTVHDTLSFAMKGVNPNGRNTLNSVTVTLTSGSYGGPSASYTFTIDDDYQNFEIPLSAFASIDLTEVYGVKYSFGPMSYSNVYFDSIRFVNQ